MRGFLVLENGMVYEGVLFGACRDAFGEVVFNTSMTGYQEILTDPSYHGQIVTMTYPLIGNYGITDADNESDRIHLSGFVIKELSPVVSNWRAVRSLDSFLKEHGIPGIQGIDTRAVTLALRTAGAVKGGIFPEGNTHGEMVEAVRTSPSLVGRDLVRNVIRREPYWWNRSGRRTVVVVDMGVKHNQLRILASLGMKVLVMPADADWHEIVKVSPDGILLSNGPGDPEPLTYVVKTVSNLIGRYPIFGICMGHHILWQVFGGKTYKLKFGHHGANHPVRDVRTGAISITVQNHGFCGDMETLRDPQVEVTHINLNDGTLEGVRHRVFPAFSVQFHPEHSPGPHDGEYLFSQFAQMLYAKAN